MSSKQKTIFIFLFICIAVFITFLPSLFCDFVNFDDNWMLKGNHLVRKISLDNILKNVFGSIYHGVYQPLVFLSFAIEYYFFGLSPFIYHFNNVIIHLINTFLVYIFINQLSGNKKAALFACLFWSLNPMRVESVTWITERKDVLYALFYLLSLISYVQYVKSHKKLHFVLSLLFFSLSCLSKLLAVSLSFIILLLDYYYQRKPGLKSIIEKAFFFSISLFTGIFSIWAVKKDGNVAITKFIYSVAERAQLVSHSLINYLIKSVIPYNLSAFHPYKYPPGLLPQFYSVFLILTLVIIVAFIWFFFKFRNKKIVFGFLFFLSAVVFALQIFPVGEAAFADRNIYISCIGIAFLAGELYLLLVKKIHKKIINSAAFLILLVYSFLTYQQTKIWHSSHTLFTDVIEKYPDSHFGYLGRGAEKYLNNDLQGAMEDYTIALEKDPKNYTTLLNRALIRKNLKDFDGALDDFNKLLTIYPYYGNAYLARGLLYHETNRFAEAIQDFSTAIGIKPEDPFLASLALVNRSQSRVVLKDLDSAIADLNYSLRIVPDNSEAWYLKGMCYFSKNDFSKAKEDFINAIKFDQKNGKAFYSLGMCEISLNNNSLACGYLHQSARLAFADGNRMFLFHCSDSVTKDKLFYPSGLNKSNLVKGVNEQNDTILYLCNYDSSGKILQQGVVDAHTKKYKGEIKWFYPDSSLKKTGYLQDTIPFGNWKEYYPKGNIKEQYSFSNGLLHGSYKAYFPDGNIQTERFYNSGKLKNVFFCRDINGNPIKFGSFAGGNGSLKIFDESGKVISENIYKDGKLM